MFTRRERLLIPTDEGQNSLVETTHEAGLTGVGISLSQSHAGKDMDSKTQPTSSTPMSIDAETFLRSLECSAHGSHSRETGEHDWEAEAEADAAAAAAEKVSR